MKKILFVLFTMTLGTFAIAQSAATATINWISLEEAQELVKTSPRPIMVDVYTEWCGPCRKMNKYTFTDKAVIDYINKNYYAVKFNGEGGKPVSFNGKTYHNPKFDPNRNPRSRNATHEFVLATGLRSYPTLVIYSPNLKIAGRLVGLRQPPQLISGLKRYASNIK